MAETIDKSLPETESSFALSGFLSEHVVNIVLVGIIIYFIYLILAQRFDWRSKPKTPPSDPLPPKMKKRDFTLDELKPYDGTQPDGRVLVAVNGNVYDVTKGKRFYGPGGPYAAFGGKDASRGLATFSVAAKEGYDDLSDLKSHEMDSVREWEEQFKEKYDFIGKLLKPDEEPTNYSDEEDLSARGDENDESKSKDPKSRKDD